MSAEEPAEPVSSDEPDSSDDEAAGPSPLRSADDEGDEAVIAANESAGKEYPLAHRLLDQRGFRNNATLESVLTHPHEVCLILQKDQGISLSLAWQLLRVVHEAAVAPKLQVVSGHTKEGEWREMHEANLPEMFRNFRSIFARQLEQRFKVKSTPDKYTLLSLAFDPSIDTSADDGIFSESSAAQALLEGEHRRALMRRQLRTPCAPSASKASSGSQSTVVPTTPTAGPPSTSTVKAAGKRPVGPASVLTMLKPSKLQAVASEQDTGDSEKAIDDEISKFHALSAAVVAEGLSNRYFEKQIFNQKRFWFEHRTDLPLHYKTFVSEAGSMKAASANVETVFSGVGGMVAKASSLGADLVADYTICHHNWSYSFLEPSAEEIITAYSRAYGQEAHNSDAESSDGTASDESDADGMSGEEDSQMDDRE